MNLNYQVLNVCAKYLNGFVEEPVNTAQLLIKHHKDELHYKQKNLLFAVIWTAGTSTELVENDTETDHSSEG